jgi:hypothetical protein
MEPITIEYRGRHWQFKANKPEIWKSTKFWYDQCQKMELRVRATKKLDAFPWIQHHTTRGIGNQAKCIWMHLFLSEMEERSIKIDWAETMDDVTSFYRIKGFTVLDVGQFNGGMFPLPSGWSEKSDAQPPCKHKTLIHNWHAVGMHEGPDTGTMRYFPQYREAIKQQRIRMDIKRTAKKPPNSPPFTAAPMLITKEAAQTLAPIDAAPTKAAPHLPSPLELLSRIASDEAAMAIARDAVHRAHADLRTAEHAHKAAAAALCAAQAHLNALENAPAFG